MNSSLTLQSPAKLNLMLHITGRRDDGYHELQTVFQFIGLYDELRFETTEKGEICRTSNHQEFDENQDLTLRAARLLQRRYAVQHGIQISVKKNIPIGGGLGGGSSDAATTLMALNRLWRLQLSPSELQAIGRELGADIPVFIHGTSAWAEGIGDKLTALDLPQNWYLVVHPQIFVSTAQIFASKDLTRDCHPLTIRAFLEGKGENVCQPVACRLHPQIQQALDWLGQFSPARMTGTGACIFAAFDSAEQALAVKYQLPDDWSGYVARGLNRNPVTDSCF